MPVKKNLPKTEKQAGPQKPSDAAWDSEQLAQAKQKANTRADHRAINPRARSAPLSPPVTPDVKRDRIFRLASTMATGEWNEERATEFCKEWGVTPSYLRFMSAEASRLLEYTTNDRAKLVASARVRLQQIAAQDGPDRVQAQKTLLEHLGELRKRVEHSGPEGREIPIGVTAKVVVLPAEESEDSKGDE